MDKAIAWRASSIDLATERPFRVGGATIDPKSREASFAGKRERLQPQIVKVLVVLARRRGDVVTRNELTLRCWDGRVIGDDVINHAILTLRGFADRAGGGFTIETVPKAGYRLIETGAGGGAAATWRWARRNALIAGAIIGVAGVAMTWASFANRTGTAPVLSRVSVAQLATRKGDAPAEAISASLRAGLIRQLAGSETPVEIFDSLDRNGRPSLVLRGGSLSDRDRIHANLELIAFPSGRIVWTGSLDRPLAELDQFQDQVSRQVAGVLHCAFGDGRKPDADRDPAFARLVFARCAAAEEGDYDALLRLDELITQRAPRLASAWADYALDEALAAENHEPLLRKAAVSRAAIYADRALALDRGSGQAYVARDLILGEDADWFALERSTKRGLTADPTNPGLHNNRAGHLAFIGRLQDALAEAKKAYRLDRLAQGRELQLIAFNQAIGDLPEARRWIAYSRRYSPDFYWLNSQLIIAGLGGDHPREAREVILSDRFDLDAPRRAMLLAVLDWRIAPSPTTRAAALRVVNAAASEGIEDEQVRMLAYLGATDQAFEWARRMPERGVGDIEWFSPKLAAFRADPRFTDLAARIGLLDVWRTARLLPDFCNSQPDIAVCKAARRPR